MGDENDFFPRQSESDGFYSEISIPRIHLRTSRIVLSM